MTSDAAFEAIETSYAGCRFRSRLEARWAVFLDHLRIAWEYEPQGYVVGPNTRRRRYLPDFYLPEDAIWVEVKGDPSSIDYDLIVDAAAPVGGLPLTLEATRSKWPLLHIRMLMLGPVPDVPKFHQSVAVVDGTKTAGLLAVPVCSVPVDSDRHLHRFTPVSRPIPVETSKGARAYIPPTENLLESWGYGFPCPQIHGAYTAARSARFEHGQSGYRAVTA